MTNIAFKQAHSGNYRRAARGKEDIRYLVIHFTANDGDTAKNNADYFARAEISTSAHYFVDENEVWQSVRDADIAWHCGTRGVYFHPYCRNANSIGIELCSRKNGEKFYFMPETVRRAQALTRELMAKYGIPLENVVRHYDVTHKNCPAPFVESASAWTAFKQGLQKKEEPDMTEAEVKKIIESTRRTYNSVSAVPAWAKPTVEKLTCKGWLLGDEHGKLDLTEELLRTLVINDAPESTANKRSCRETTVSPTSRNGPWAVPKSSKSSSRWSKLSPSIGIKTCAILARILGRAAPIHAPGFYEFAVQILLNARCCAICVKFVEK